MPSPYLWTEVAESALTGTAAVDSLIYGYQWASSTLTFSFPGFGATWSPDPFTGYPMHFSQEPYAGFAPLESSDIAAVRDALQSWSSVSGLLFSEVSDTATEVGDLRFAYSSAVAGAQAWAYTPSPTAFGGDVWFSSTSSSFFESWNPGSYEYMTAVHEIGHALGLKHPFEISDLGNDVLNATVISTALDSRSYTVMSYAAAPGNTSTYFNYEPTTPMILDVAAIQALYGANPNHNADDTNYVFSSGQYYHETIWDAGGIDTLTLTGTLGGIIDLRAGTDYGSRVGQVVRVLNAQGSALFAVDNVWIAYGVVIENATGGSGKDTITGNEIANTLDGGAGADTLIGGQASDTYLVDNTGDVIVEKLGEGDDVVHVAIATTGATYTLAAHLESGLLTNTLANNLTGNTLGNTLTGNAAANTLDGGAGADTLAGGEGNDTYIVENVGDEILEHLDEGADLVKVAISTAGGDYTLGGGVENGILTNLVAFTLVGNGLDNTLTGNAAANTLVGLAGDDTLDGKGGADVLIGGQDDDTYVIDQGGDSVVEEADAGSDLVRVALSNAGGSYTLAAHVEHATLINAVAFKLVGNDLANTLIGNALANTLDGGAGDDVLNGGLGNDTYFIGAGDSLIDTGGIDTVISGVDHSLGADFEHLTLSGNADLDGTGNALANTIFGNTGANTLDGAGGVDLLKGGGGDDTYLVDLGATNLLQDALAENTLEGNDTVVLRGGNTVLQTYATLTLGNHLENLDAHATTTTRLHLIGNALANTLTGNDAANTLDGGLGADALIGGLGDDTYVIDTPGDTITEQAAEGTDLVKVAVAAANGTHTLASNVDNGTLINAVAYNLTGNALANTLTGNALANTLDGGSGADSLIGGLGNDTYIIYDIGDTITDSGGSDTVRSSLTYSLGATLENLVLTGSDAINGTGNGLANTLTGNDGANTLTGGLGNDTYVLGPGDLAVETSTLASEIDTVQSSVTYSLGANLEHLTLSGNADNDGTGNALANTILGNAGANTLDGAGGVDFLKGGGGDDTYLVDLTASNLLQDGITEILNEGQDSVVLRGGNSGLLTYATLALGAHLETLDASGTTTARLHLIGNALANTLTGNDAANTLDGKAGADHLIGGLGDDTYVVDALGDEVSESAGQGTDTLRILIAAAGGSFTLAAHVENALLLNTVAFNLTGNDLANTLTGNAAANTLDGGGGADSLIGGLGNDTYIIDDIGDSISDSGGIDTVYTPFDTSLAANLENLVLTLAGLSGQGNALANTLTSLGGNSTLAGGLGNDTYLIGTGDSLIDSGGIDTVVSSVDHSLGADFEHLTLSGNADLDGTGNALANTILGNAGANTLDGAGGVDLLKGGIGDDTYRIDLAATNLLQDALAENTLEGNDTVVLRGGNTVLQTYVTLTLGNHLENLDASGTTTARLHLSGNALDNTLSGNDAANTLDGKAGADALIGGLGDDTYVIDALGDEVSESAGQGTDTLRILIAAAGGSFTLAAHVENALLLNTVAFNLTGNDLANTLTGNAAANTLDGGGGADLLDGKGGADRLIGGLGNDTYVVDHGGDVVVENSGEGTDTVAVAIATTGSHTLADQVENGVLINGVAFHLYGNGLANTLTGNAAGNTLVGGAGADVLDGAGSADVLRGGADEDLYRVDLTSGNLQQDAVVELAGEGSDTIVLRGGNASLTSFATLTLAAEVENLDASGTGSARLHLTGNALANTLTGNGAGNTLNGAAGADVLIGGAGDDAYVVDDVGDQIVEDPGAGADQVILSILAAGASYVLADNVETVRMTSAVGLTLVGNDSANTLYGGLGDDYLIGNDGNDRLYADGGSDAAPGVGSGDILEGGLGDDVYFGVGVGVQVIEAVGEGWDSVYLAYSNGPTLIDLASDFQNVESLSLINATGVTRVVGTAAAERLEGNSAANTLEGNGGNDTLLGGGGQDVLIGGTGDDYYDIDSLDDIIIEDPGGGQDFVHVSRGNTTATPWNLAYSDVEAVDLGGAAGAINLTGGSEANTFYGNASANVLSGGAGNDTLTGGAGNDTLDGGNDDDVLYGGTGLDRLTGGSGADSFHFNAPLLAANLKTLTDFSAGTDTLVFEALGIAGLPASYDESMFQSAANHVASSLAVRFLYDSALGNLYYDADGSAAAKSAVLFAHLDGNPALSATDITIV